MKRIVALSIFIFVISLCGYAQYNELIVETLLKTDTTLIGQSIEYPITDHPEVTILKITLPPGANTGWHKHIVPLFAYVVEGTLSVEVDDGRIVEFSANSAIAESFDTYHIGRNNCTDTNVVLIAFYMGVRDVPLAAPRTEPQNLNGEY
jgi:quercetin dioxygenase-like cupin family protein